MTLSYITGSSNINLKSTSSGNSVTLGGNALNTGLIFDGVGGEWDLLDSISSNKVLPLFFGIKWYIENQREWY